jgi:hypothetical protein
LSQTGWATGLNGKTKREGNGKFGKEGALLPRLRRESIQKEKQKNHALAVAIPFRLLCSLPLPDGFARASGQAEMTERLYTATGSGFLSRAG